MTPVWMIARTELRRRQGSLLVLVALVVVVTAVVLATTAGARRSASALDRMLAATDANDFQIGVYGVDVADELAADVRAIDGVRELGIGVGTVLGLPTEFDASLVWSPDGSLLDRVDRAVVLDGRMPDPDRAHEVAVNELAAAELDLAVGDRADPQPPTRLFNVHEVVGPLPALGTFFIVLAGLGLFHGLAVSTRSGRRDLGVLAALGLRRRDTRRVVTWQATSTAGIGLLIGIPAGAIIGRAGWNLVVADIGMLGGPVVPWPGITLTVLGALVLAALLAWPIGRHFSYGHPADLLRVE